MFINFSLRHYRTISHFNNVLENLPSDFISRFSTVNPISFKAKRLIHSAGLANERGGAIESTVPGSHRVVARVPVGPRQ
jgi:hypothetical protein